MKSNGLPYPLEQRIIDTSKNPGRCILKRGYHEAVGSVVWLGEPFWQLSGAEKSSLAYFDWLRVSHPEQNVIRIQSAESCFSGPDAKDGEIQRRLRKLLFPSAAPNS